MPCLLVVYMHGYNNSHNPKSRFDAKHSELLHMVQVDRVEIFWQVEIFWPMEVLR